MEIIRKVSIVESEEVMVSKNDTENICLCLASDGWLSTLKELLFIWYGFSDGRQSR